VHSAAFWLLLQAQDAAANIAATTANDINTFFIFLKFNWLNTSVSDKNNI
jgi:hypothetical protein